MKPESIVSLLNVMIREIADSQSDCIPNDCEGMEKEMIKIILQEARDKIVSIGLPPMNDIEKELYLTHGVAMATREYRNRNKVYASEALAVVRQYAKEVAQ